MKFEAQLPATYTDDDPLDIEVVKMMIDDLHTDWYMEDAATQRQAIANAFRVAFTSPRQTLKWNSIVYQDLMNIPPEEANPDIYEQTIRDRKGKWDAFGQQTLDMIGTTSDDPEWIDYGPGMVEKYQPGIWGNVRNCAIVAPYIEDLRQFAVYDIQQGGDGRYWRENVLDLGIPGVGPKITSFAWLLLAPKTSKLATIDIHMMRVLGKKDQSPATYADYLNFEKELDDMRKQMGYGEEVSLGMFQWAMWDKWRTPGYHQTHTALRPLNPVDWRNVDWSPQSRHTLQTPPPIPEDQLALPVDQPMVVSAWKPLGANWQIIE